MAPVGGHSAFASRLHKFFGECLSEKSTLDPDVRKHRLYARLAVIWSYASAYSNCGPRKSPFPEDFQRLFADPNDMDLLSADQDTYTLVVVPCIILLLASKVVEDQSGNLPASEEELASLKKALSPFWQPGLP